MYLDLSYLIFVLPALLLSIWASSAVKSRFAKYDRIPVKKGVTGAQAAQILLRANGINDVKIARIGGCLTDNYNPTTKTLSLSDATYSSSSIAAVGVAAHETGHAIQHNKGYFPAKLRKGVVVFSNAVSVLLWPLVFIGIMYNFVWFDGVVGSIFLWSGIGFFGIAVILNLVTLPVEYNASNRALAILEQTGILDSTELPGCKKVLRAAGLTYVASLVMSILILLRFVLLAFAGRQK